MTVGRCQEDCSLRKRCQVQPGLEDERLVPAEIYDDGRLFKEYLLYSEGLHKPALRGYLHLAAACIVPILALFLLFKTTGVIPRIAVALYFAGKMWCFGVSGLYHVFPWSARVEIVLHKLDHCGIFAMTAGCYSPAALLLLSCGWNLYLLVTAWITCAYGCWYVFRCKPALWRFLLCATTIAPALSALFMRMTWLEVCCTLLTWVQYGVGLAVFTKMTPDPFPHVFGYHEIFHLLVVGAGVTTYLVNSSIVTRVQLQTVPDLVCY